MVSVVSQPHVCRGLVEGQIRICPVQEVVVRRTSLTVTACRVSGEEVVGLEVCLRICRFALSVGEPVEQILAS